MFIYNIWSALYIYEQTRKIYVKIIIEKMKCEYLLNSINTSSNLPVLRWCPAKASEMIIQGKNTILYDCWYNISFIFHGHACDKDYNTGIITYLLFKINKLNVKYGCIVCSSIYGFWLPLWYLQTLPTFDMVYYYQEQFE